MIETHLLIWNLCEWCKPLCLLVSTYTVTLTTISYSVFLNFLPRFLSCLTSCSWITMDWTFTLACFKALVLVFLLIHFLRICWIFFFSIIYFCHYLCMQWHCLHFTERDVELLTFQRQLFNVVFEPKRQTLTLGKYAIKRGWWLWAKMAAAENCTGQTLETGVEGSFFPKPSIFRSLVTQTV